MSQLIRVLFGFCLLMGLGLTASAGTVTLCVYDPGGKSGDYYRLMQNFGIEASKWGVEVQLRAYTDEETAAKDYDAGQCDGVVATGVRLQRFNRFPSTIEAIGALPEYAYLKQLVNSLATSDHAAKRLQSGNHETVGIVPVGAVYLFVADRSLDSVGALAGKRIATMDYDKASLVMVDRVGAIVVPVDLGSVGPKFNNGDVDACYVSAPAYQPFELGKGLANNGGVLRLPLAQATLQVMLHRDRFPDGFGSQARKYFAQQFDSSLRLVKKAEADIPAKYWIAVPDSEMAGFEELFLATRLKLRDEEQAYDRYMLSALRNIRCANDPSRSECVEKKE